ncbi:hypothetical protein ACWCQZ_49000 [Streptomyces sp. NPDC002285]
MAVTEPDGANLIPATDATTADAPSVEGSGISLGRRGLNVRAGRHLYLHLSPQLMGWFIAIGVGAGAGGVGFGILR